MHRYSARSFVLGCLAAALPNTAWSQGSLAITGVTVIDGTGRAPIHGATILIREGTIVAVGPSRLIPVPRGAERIKADGRFVIAGLWDAHVHLLAAYRALLAEADRKGLLVAGHQPNEPVGLAGALAAGQRSIEHIENLGELEKLPAPSRDSVVQGFATFGRFAPESLTAARVAGTTAEPGQATVTEELRAFWRAGMALKPFDPPPEEMRKIADGGLAGMRRLRTAAVKVMAGTDLAVLNLYPGVSLHEELAFLVDSLGLTPLEAIQAATVEPARSFRISNTIGTIEPGRAADLLILSANPLTDIRNTRRIETVILRGRVVRPNSSH